MNPQPTLSKTYAVCIQAGVLPQALQICVNANHSSYLLGDYCVQALCWSPSPHMPKFTLGGAISTHLTDEDTEFQIGGQHVQQDLGF